MNLRFPLPADDHIVITRPGQSAAVDGQGKKLPHQAPQWDGMGHWRTPRASDMRIAGALADQVDAVIVVPPEADPRAGDRVSVVGQVWTVVSTVFVRYKLRAFIRRVGIPGN